MSDTLFDTIRAYLIDHWDPIGIGPLASPDGPEDEYDAYARDLAQMVVRGSSPGEYSAYLAEAEDHMGVARSDARTNEAARFLAALARR